MREAGQEKRERVSQVGKDKREYVRQIGQEKRVCGHARKTSRKGMGGNRIGKGEMGQNDRKGVGGR